MQVYQCKICAGDALSFKILNGMTSPRLQNLLLTQGVEIKLKDVELDFITLEIRAPSGLMIVEELAQSLDKSVILA